MKASCHQPNFIPWLGYFYKIAISDTFVFLDDVNYTKQTFINRNRIKSPNGSVWLTLPLVHSALGTPINKKIIINPIKSIKRITETIKANYIKTVYFNAFFEKFEYTLNNSGSQLDQVNIELIKLILKELKINTILLKSSELKKISGVSTSRLVAICKEINAQTYISGFGGMKYQSDELFNEENIKCETYNFIHPVYPQRWSNFLPNMSIIDLIFNCGPQSRKILLGEN